MNDEKPNLPPYIEEYNNFIKELKTREVDAKEVGALVAKLAQYYSTYNLLLAGVERALSLVALDIENRKDENGKTISSAKAKVITDATEEAATYNELRAHRMNIEQFINSLKSLQRGLQNEYQHMDL